MLSDRSSSRRLTASPAPRNPARGITIPPGSASWSSSWTGKRTTLRVMTGTAGRMRRQTNRWCQLRPLLLR
jgi:hypothetical protein